MIKIGTSSIKGRSVIATAPISKNTLIEIAPTASFPAEEWSLIKKTDIFKYCFVTPDEYQTEKNAKGYIVFGLSSLCNHSQNPNAEIKWVHSDPTDVWAHLIALSDIELGEEISIFYTNIDQYSSAKHFI